MKRWRLLILALVLCLPALSLAEYWPHDVSHAVSCKDNRSGCRILQMVMMGCFDYAETPDSLDERVLSAVLPQLKAIAEEDFQHFCAEFSVEEAVIRRHYNAAMANCLLSDIHLNPDPGGEATLVRRVLHLFLDPSIEPDADMQIKQIRSEMTDALLKRMAEELEIPQSFVVHLLGIEQAP